MPSLPADRAIEDRFIWTSRKTAKPARSYEAIREWCVRVERAHEARLIGDGVRRVLLAMADFVGPEGCAPSQETLAKASGRDLRTVKRAVHRAPVLGLLRVRHRPRFIIRTGSTIRLGRQTNDYTLLIPRDLPALAPSSMQKKGRDSNRRGSGANLSPSAPASVEAQRAALPVAIESLAAISARREGVIAANLAATSGQWFRRR